MSETDFVARATCENCGLVRESRGLGNLPSLLCAECGSGVSMVNISGTVDVATLPVGERPGPDEIPAFATHHRPRPRIAGPVSERSLGVALEEAARVLREQLTVAAAKAGKAMAAFAEAARKDRDQ